MDKILILTLEGTGDSRELASGELSLGRARDNGWVLTEPGTTSSVSRRHCRVAMGPEGPTITDLGSKNGTRVDGRALVPRIPMPLRGGEAIEIGLLRLMVDLVEPWSLAPALPAVAPAVLESPFGTLGPGMPPLLSPMPPRSELPESGSDTIFGHPGAADLFGAEGASAPSRGGMREDPLAGAFNEQLEPFSRGAAAAFAPTRPVPSGNAQPQLEALPPRTPVSPQGEAPPASSQPMTLATDPLGSFDPLAGLWTAAEPDRPATTEARPEAPIEARRYPAGPSPTDTPPAVIMPPTGEVLPPAHLDRSTGAASSCPGPADTSTAALLGAFLEGAGLQASFAQGRDPLAFLGEAGRVFAHLADGLRELLTVRALIKEQTGIERTQISASLNNPLKLSVSGHEATVALLGGREEKGYLSPVAAVDAGFRDLKGHELAVLEGIQSAVEELLELFDPAKLESKLDEAGILTTVIQGGRRARLWELYQERYDEIAKSARLHFMGRLDDAFHAAYARKSAEMSAHIDAPGDPPAGVPRP